MVFVAMVWQVTLLVLVTFANGSGPHLAIFEAVLGTFVATFVEIIEEKGLDTVDYYP